MPCDSPEGKLEKKRKKLKKKEKKNKKKERKNGSMPFDSPEEKLKRPPEINISFANDNLALTCQNIFPIGKICLGGFFVHPQRNLNYLKVKKFPSNSLC